MVDSMSVESIKELSLLQLSKFSHVSCSNLHFIITNKPIMKQSNQSYCFSHNERKHSQHISMKSRLIKNAKNLQMVRSYRQTNAIDSDDNS